MYSRLAALAVAFALSTSALAAPAAPGPLKGFVSDKSKDYFGYFLPASPIAAGKWSLRNLFVAPPADLKTFEAGKSDKAFGGVMIEFEDLTSPVKTGEDSIPYHTGQIRVLPTAYAVGNGRLRFVGTDKVLGTVSFEGTFGADFFKKPTPDVPHPDDHPVLKGKLTIAGKSFDASFNWFGGD